MRGGKEYIGSAWMTTAPTATAGEMGTIQLVYRAGKYGIDDRGSFLVAWRSISDMEMPQFDRPTESGYTTMSSTGKIKARMSFMKYLRPYHNSIKIEIYDGYLREGEELTVTFGDRSQGSPGIRMQSFYEREFEMIPLVDACGTGRYEKVPLTDAEGKTTPERMTMEILPGLAKTLQVSGPTLIQPQEEFSVALRVLDLLGNVTSQKEGKISLRIVGPQGGVVPPSAEFKKGHSGVIHVPGCKVTEPGVYHIYATDEQTGQVAVSNPCLCMPEIRQKLFWGDMHGQTRETLGCGRLEDYLAFARDSALIDFTSWQGNDFELTDQAWEFIRQTVKDFNEEGKFLVYLGYEWSGTSNAGGDHNVYFLGDSEEFYPSSNWVVPGQAKVENNAFPITQLHERCHGRKDVMVTPHIGGRCSNLDFYNPEFLHNIEIHSQHGIFEWFALEAMKRRLRVGFVATSDDHSGKPGLSYPSISEDEFAGALAVRSGLTGVYASELTKPAIWDALIHRHCYASTLDRLYLETHIGEAMMGDEVTMAQAPQTLEISAAGSGVFDALCIYDWDQLLERRELRPKRTDAIRIRFSGVTQRGRNKEADWSGSIAVKGGKILKAERCGYTLGMKEPKVCDDGSGLSYQLKTNGEVKGFVLTMDMKDDTCFTVETPYGAISFTTAELQNGRIAKEMGGENLLIEVDFANQTPATAEECLESSQLKLSYPIHPQKGEHAYWVKVAQEDGNAAWSSPIFVDVQKD